MKKKTEKEKKTHTVTHEQTKRRQATLYQKHWFTSHTRDATDHCSLCPAVDLWDFDN